MTDWKAKCEEKGIDYSDFEERAAKREYDGGYDRAKAEKLAFTEILAEKRRKDETGVLPQGSGTQTCEDGTID